MSLQEIQKELKAPKSQYNTFGNYNYRNQEDILEALKPLLNRYDYTLEISDEMVEVGGRVYVKATPVLKDKAGKVVVTTTAYAREPESRKGMDVSQITGATSSYARKYALNGMFLIDDTKDADSMKPDNDKPKTTTTKKGTTATKKPTTDDPWTKPQRKKIWAVLMSRSLDKEAAKAFVDYWMPEEKRTKLEAMAFIDRLEKEWGDVWEDYMKRPAEEKSDEYPF